MALTGLEWVVAVFAALGLLKMIIVLVNRKGWMPVIHEIYGHPSLFSWLFFILAAFIFWILLQELTIVQIMACMAFTSLVVVIALLHYSKDMIRLANKVVTSKLEGWLIVYILIWTALFILALWTILA